MPGNAFIKFNGGTSLKSPGDPKGESVQADFKDWIDIGDWSWDVEAEHSVTKGTGAAVGKPQAGVLSFSKFYDTSSPRILGNMIRGVHFNDAVLVMCKQTGKHNTPQPYLWIVMKTVFTTKVANKGSEDGSVSQDVELVFKEVEIYYSKQENTGDLKPAGEFGWDIGKNTLTK